MLPLGMLITFAGYGLASYGYVLVKGWDITFASWWNPLNPWEWTAASAASPPVIPPTQVLPSAAAAAVKPPDQAGAPGGSSGQKTVT